MARHLGEDAPVLALLAPLALQVRADLRRATDQADGGVALDLLQQAMQTVIPDIATDRTVNHVARSKSRLVTWPLLATANALASRRPEWLCRTVTLQASRAPSLAPTPGEGAAANSDARPRSVGRSARPRRTGRIPASLGASPRSSVRLRRRACAPPPLPIDRFWPPRASDRPTELKLRSAASTVAGRRKRPTLLAERAAGAVHRRLTRRPIRDTGFDPVSWSPRGFCRRCRERPAVQERAA